MHVELRDRPFDPWQEVQAYQDRQDRAGQYGATAVFVGTMRDFNEGDTVHGMELEHYPGMTERALETLVQESRAKHGFLDCLVLHRVGYVSPNDPIVLVAVWSAHRAAAFDASREIMEALKSTVPFWKKEQLEAGSRWVAKNTPG